MPEHASGPYKVCCAQKELEQLRALAAKAASLGIREEFLTAIKTVNQKLTTDPLTWGDPQYHMHNLGLLFCHGI